MITSITKGRIDFFDKNNIFSQKNEIRRFNRTENINFGVDPASSIFFATLNKMRKFAAETFDLDSQIKIVEEIKNIVDYPKNKSEKTLKGALSDLLYVPDILDEQTKKNILLEPCLKVADVKAKASQREFLSHLSDNDFSNVELKKQFIAKLYDTGHFPATDRGVESGGSF